MWHDFQEKKRRRKYLNFEFENVNNFDKCLE